MCLMHEHLSYMVLPIAETQTTGTFQVAHDWFPAQEVLL